MSKHPNRTHASLLDSLECALPYASENLVPHKARQRLEHLALALPPIVRGLLECRLVEAETVDLSIGVLDTVSDKTRLHDCFAKMNDSSPAWERIMAFMSEWEGQTDSSPSSRFAWFEFDLDRHGSGYPAPSVFLSFGEPAAAATWNSALLQLSETAPERVAYWLSRLPSGAVVDFVGVMVPREQAPIRLNMSGLTSETAWRWLADNGVVLPDSFRDVFDMLYDISAPSLTVEAGETRLGPRVGLECRPSSVAAAEEVFDLCHALSLCSPNVMADAERWRGKSSAFGPAADLPMHMLLEAAVQPEAPPTVLLREVNHIKFTFTPSGVEEAKIYLLVERV